MKLFFSKKAEKAYKKLPLSIKKKADKQFQLLRTNISHPSLHVKKMRSVERWEARVDRSYRFTFDKVEDSISIRTVGPHDEGLGKK